MRNVKICLFYIFEYYTDYFSALSVLFLFRLDVSVNAFPIFPGNKYDIFVYKCTFAGKGVQFVTCGSILKLMNVEYKVRLHSHDINYGSGSRQQSVTGTLTNEDGNSYWLVKAGTKKECNRGCV